MRFTRSGARTCAGIGLGGEALLRPARPTYALVAHEPGHLVPPDVEAGPTGRLGELAPAVDRVVVLPELDEVGAELGVTDRPGRGGPCLGVVVGGGGDLQAPSQIGSTPHRRPPVLRSRWASMKTTTSSVGGRAPPRRNWLPPGGCRWSGAAPSPLCAAPSAPAVHRW